MKAHALLKLSLPVLFVSLGLCSCTHLVGTVHDSSYTGARGDYSVPFPVLADMGGNVVGDDVNGVTFRDDFGSRVSVYSYVLPRSPAEEERVRIEGADALMALYIRKMFRVESWHSHPEVRKGAISFAITKNNTRCGVAIFAHGLHIYTVENDLPTVTQFLMHSQNLESKDAWLESRALKVLQSIQLAGQ